MIGEITSSDVSKITSGQVILDLVSVAKELVENALDAGSTQIEITYHNYGIDGIEVADNGHGIATEDFASVCLRHHTSKLRSFEDLRLVSSLGFRGEAMSSMAALGKVKIITCSKETFPKATTLEYDRDGKIRVQKLRVTGKTGTTTTVTDLFHELPVRRKTLEKHGKREYGKSLLSIMAYLLAYPPVRFTIHNVLQSGKKMVMSTKGGNSALTDVLVSCFGSNGAYGSIPVDIEVREIDSRFRLDHRVPSSLSLHVTGIISEFSFGMGRGASDRQFLTINHRPVIHKKFIKIINDVYKLFNTLQSPMFVLDLLIDNSFLDVNVTPDKRTVMIQSEEVLGEVLREELCKMYDLRGNSVPRSSLALSQVPQKRERPKVLSDDEESELSTSKRKGDATVEVEEDDEGDSASLSDPELRKLGPRHSQPAQLFVPQHENVESDTDDAFQDIRSDDIEEMFSQDQSVTNLEQALLPEVAIRLIDENGALNESEERQSDDENDSETSPKVNSDISATTELELETSANSPQELAPSRSSLLNYSDESETPNELFDLFAILRGHLPSTPAMPAQNRDVSESLHIHALLQNLASTLQIHKSDFAEMNIAGQFNLGFVVVEHNNRLFIVDQHALDEIYNYERLMLTLLLRAQPLVAPRSLELSPIEEMQVLEYAESLKKNGFVVEENEDEVPGKRVTLKAVPVLKNVVFNDSDLHELVQRLHESGGSLGARCSKVSRMIALRACRGSVMVGQALSKSTMNLILHHLSGLSHPWNCPHGRPTMRHLADLEGSGFSDDYKV